MSFYFLTGGRLTQVLHLTPNLKTLVPPTPVGRVPLTSSSCAWYSWISFLDIVGDLVPATVQAGLELIH